MFKDATLLDTLNLTLSNTYSSNSVDGEGSHSHQEEPELNKEEDKNHLPFACSYPTTFPFFQNPTSLPFFVLHSLQTYLLSTMLGISLKSEDSKEQR